LRCFKQKQHKEEKIYKLFLFARKTAGIVYELGRSRKKKKQKENTVFY
jgi:hypothetical protein